MSIAIIVHGGARSIPPEKEAANEAGCQAAAEAGWQVLERGGSALDAVETAIRVLEADPTFNAAFGATLNPDGVVRMDAGLMEGDELQAGAVGCVEAVRHPITIARKLVEEPTIMLVGEYAYRYAAEQGLELCAPEELVTDEQRTKWYEAQQGEAESKASNDTVGCVALDRHGTLAAGASTGGTGTHPPGRVGDSPLPGCGYYAENRFGGCSMTGEGEDIMRLALSRAAVELMRDGGDPESAAHRAIELLTERIQGEAGCILVDPQGRVGWAYNSSHMAVGYRFGSMPAAVAYVRKEDEEGQEEQRRAA